MQASGRAKREVKETNEEIAGTAGATVNAEINEAQNQVEEAPKEVQENVEEVKEENLKAQKEVKERRREANDKARGACCCFIY
jgi:hypothetical protein